MVSHVCLSANEEPPGDIDFVAVTIAVPGKVSVTSQFGDGKMKAVAFADRDPTAALAKAMTTADDWCKALGLSAFYIRRLAGVPADA